MAPVMKPLLGRRIAVCDADGESAVVKALQRLGAEPRPWQGLSFGPAPDPSAVDRACATPEAWNWIVVTSWRAAEAIGPRRDRCLTTRVAAVGERTAAALLSLGWDVAHTGDGGSEDLVRGMMESGLLTPSQRVLYPVSALGGYEAVALLRSVGIECQRVEAYTVFPHCPHPERVVADIESGLDAIAFTSPSAVSAVEAAIGDGFSSALRSVVVAAIGPTTGEALASRAPLSHLAVADPVGSEGLLDALLLSLESEK